ncbi:hypothetical protein O3P69_014397 [Scylla paramamosain]|uniref:Uncharacterized protein n=1 Tax=Scylla paramamosain TaxID=85552 RepID=A0AAW0TB01_SCYPA
MTRYPFQPTNLSERTKFISMWVRGKSTRSIARETGVSASTVCRWINRWRQEGNVYNKPRSCSSPYVKASRGQVLASPEAKALGAVQAVTASQVQHQCPVILVLNNPSQVTLTFLKEVQVVQGPRGVSVFHVKAENLEDNITLTHFRATVDNVRQAVSKITRTRRFTSAPTLKVAIELLPHHSISWVEDPETPEGGRLDFTGYMDRTIRYFAKGMNFTPKYVLSPERTFGTKLPDGSWTGMMGMVVREVSEAKDGKVRPLQPCVLKVSVLSGSSSRALLKPNSVSLTPNADVAWPTEWWWWQRVDVESGVFREVANLEEEGRLKFHTQAQFPTSLDTLVRAGDHVLVDIEITIRNLIALDVSQKGRCDFYLSRDGFLPYSSAIMSQKTNPLIHGLNARVIALTESGLFKYWMQDVPNFTTCNSVPKTVLFTTTLSTTNLWGMFAVLAGGLTAGLVVWCAELMGSYVMEYCCLTPSSA